MFLLLLIGQASNVLAIAAFPLLTDTASFASFTLVTFLGQTLCPLFNLRLDIQLQSETGGSIAVYYLRHGLWLQAVNGGSFLLLVAWLGQPDHLLAVLFAVSLTALETARSFCIGAGSRRGLGAIEASTAVRNALFLGLAISSDGESMTQSYVVLALVQATVVLATLVRAHDVGLRPINPLRLLDRANPAARRARKVIAFSFPNSLLGMLISRAPIIAVEMAVSPVVADAFISAVRLSTAPFSLLVHALRVVGVLEVNKRRSGHADRFAHLCLGIWIVAPLALSPMLFPGTLGPLLERLDPSWTDAAAWLPTVYAYAVLFIYTGWTDRVFDALGLQGEVFRIELVFLLLTLLVCAAVLLDTLGATESVRMVTVLMTLQALAWFTLFLRRVPLR